MLAQGASSTGAQPLTGAGPPSGAEAPPQASVERRLSLPELLFLDGSLTAAGLSGLGLGSMSLGSQDISGLLDSTLQHMQTLPRKRQPGPARTRAEATARALRACCRCPACLLTTPPLCPPCLQAWSLTCWQVPNGKRC